MAENTIRRWLTKRFVLICEITGYTISIAVGVLLVYSFFREVEVTTRIPGELHPHQTLVTVERSSLLLAYEQPDGALVTEEATVATVVQAPSYVRRIRTRNRAEQALELLDQSPADEDGDVAALLREVLGKLPASGPTVGLQAPETGVFSQRGSLPEDGFIEADGSVGAVYLVGRARFAGTLAEDADVSALEVGATARLRLSATGDLLVGKVTAVTTTATGTRIEALLDQVPVETQTHFHDRIAQEMPMAEAGELRVVVGSRSLFMEIFGKK